ncbi:hypothetical protein [Burkholderia sp. TSV86]|uniref:hypothetical protein n=1 Tax=Burkholderia sp. TSV86 TaxID=1385594 RepID=UPI0012E3CFED|nr:hypothetical protein [Burkholderia sp. TSV86]
MSVSPRIGFLYFDCDGPLSDHRAATAPPGATDRVARRDTGDVRDVPDVRRIAGNRRKTANDACARRNCQKPASNINVVESMTLSSRGLLRAIDRTQNNACVLGVGVGAKSLLRRGNCVEI